MSSQVQTCPRCNKSTPNLEMHRKVGDCKAHFELAPHGKFEFTYMNNSYVGPGYFWVDQWLDVQDAQDVCWNAALVNSVNASLGSRVFTKRMVAKMLHTDEFKRKDLQPSEFEEAANMVLHSKECPAKLTLGIRKWKEPSAKNDLLRTLEQGNGAMISVNYNQHVQVVLGYAKKTGKVLLYDTADNTLEAPSLSTIADHVSTEWIYLFN